MISYRSPKKGSDYIVTRECFFCGTIYILYVTREFSMLCLKEWLELDRIRTEVYEPALNEIIAEMAVRKTARFFLESMEDEDGSPAELADPFDGSDDAKPVSSREEEEGTDQDQNAPDERYDSKMKIRLSDGRVLTSQRDIAKALKDASLWIRWAGMLERTRAIRQLQSMRQEENPNYKPTIRENASGGLDFNDLMKADFEISKTIPILEKLGYIDVDELTRRSAEGRPEFSKEQIEEKIRKAFHDATEESGNKIPPGITEEQIEKNADRARNDFFIILRNFFDRQYNQLSRSGRNTGMRGAGMKLYDTDELANKFILRMLDKISKRPNNQDSIKPWVGLRSDKTDFGKVGSEELENDEFVDEILDHFKRLLYKEPSKAEDERRIAMSPSKGAKDEFSNRDKKKSRINVDVKEALKAQAEGKTPDSLKFYIDFLKDSKGKKESSYDPSTMTEEDRFRFEIMSDILYRASTNPTILSLDPSKIIATLQNYRTHYLSRSKAGPSFMSVMGSKNDDGSSWDAATPSDDERAYGRGATSQTDYGLSGSYSNPAAEVIGGEERRSLLGKLRQALVNLKNKNTKWAVAICHKFHLGCGDDGSISTTSPEKILSFLGAVVNKKAEKKTSCKNQLDAIGFSKQQVAQLIPLDLGSGKQATVDTWIDQGLEFLCQELNKLFADQRGDGTASATTAPSDSKEPDWKTMERPKPLPQSRPMLTSKPSPLARMMKRTQG
jgi:hypothetical protein